ncbi:uncharacterized protein LOC103307652 [Acyrthosiphon pisum]|uniref:Uncharacterized protein n=1 Tax=Acyrthosiphon pisum TaxID=7029 RepID=A0A8R2NV26_ACYPI|nr:uncharacterized protein LOC103307652 [Acyrthosiphon pisum]
MKIKILKVYSLIYHLTDSSEAFRLSVKQKSSSKHRLEYPNFPLKKIENHNSENNAVCSEKTNTPRLSNELGSTTLEGRSSSASKVELENISYSNVIDNGKYFVFKIVKYNTVDILRTSS